jgi:hypothetical protein
VQKESCAATTTASTTAAGSHGFDFRQPEFRSGWAICVIDVADQQRYRRLD